MNGPKKRLADQEDQHDLREFSVESFGGGADKHPNDRDDEARSDNADKHGKYND